MVRNVAGNLGACVALAYYTIFKRRIHSPQAVVSLWRLIRFLGKPYPGWSGFCVTQRVFLLLAIEEVPYELLENNVNSSYYVLRLVRQLR